MSAALPATMQAAVLAEFGSLTLDEVPVPIPGPGEILVRVRACGICGTDLKIVKGAYRGTWPPALPFIIGHEWSGEVAVLGPGTERSGLAPGDRVVAENHTGCAACPMCRAGRYNLCERVREPGFRLYGHTAPGALAEYAVRPAVALHKVPASVSSVAAALVNQGALTVHAARRTGLGPGDSVAVFGPGLLGLLMLQVARAAGATTVIMIGRGKRLAMARDLGADHAIDYEQADPVEGVRAATGGRGADHVLDCSGNTAVIGQALRSARRGGSVALLGLAGGALAELPVDLVTLDELNVLGVRSSPNAYPAMISLLASGAIVTEPLTADQYPLSDVGAAFAALAGRESIRPIITM
ncbi:MAG TPA: alcohol dehydrogenase catalytic domain-containing protein [Streptosporangiaceae bacterium]|nr:alcohol dehydrogenase catalytic domain-containing protein [Streptosporangiaceae bacterium]